MDLGVIVTICLAVCAGLFYLANQLPKFYEVIWGYCLGFCITVMFTAFGYSKGIVASHDKIYADWDAGRPDTSQLGEGITFAMKSISEMDDFRTFAIVGGILALYVWFLRILPLLKQQEQEKP